MSSPRQSSNSSKPRGPYRKSRADVYTVLLALALTAIVIGLVFLTLEMDIYIWEFKGGPIPTASLQRPISVAVADLSQSNAGRLSEIYSSLAPIL